MPRDSVRLCSETRVFILNLAANQEAALNHNKFKETPAYASTRVLEKWECSMQKYRRILHRYVTSHSKLRACMSC